MLTWYNITRTGRPTAMATTVQMQNKTQFLSKKRFKRQCSWLFSCHWTLFVNDKVNRCLARYSPRHNHQPTHQQGTKWASNGQKCQFQAKLGCFWAKNLTGEIKSFVTHITENPPRHLIHIVFWSGIGQNVQKMAIFGLKWPKMHILDQFCPFLGQIS